MQASFRELKDEGSSVSKKLLGAYACPGNYVSRVVYFDEGNPDTEWFYNFLESQLGGERVRRRDIRHASRYGWELRRGAFGEIQRVTGSRKVTPKITEVYWTFYPKDDNEKKYGTFICGVGNEDENKGCRKLFTQDTSSTERFCPDCRKSARE